MMCAPHPRVCHECVLLCYVCMCACVHVCMCACVHVCMCACVHVCMCACMYGGGGRGTPQEVGRMVPKRLKSIFSGIGARRAQCAPGATSENVGKCPFWADLPTSCGVGGLSGLLGLHLSPPPSVSAPMGAPGEPRGPPAWRAMRAAPHSASLDPAMLYRLALG